VETPPSAGTGTLTLNATPWADFYLDGHRLSGCPVVGLAAEAGDHRLRIVCPDGQERTQSLHLGRGDAAKRVFDCSQSGIPALAPP
jgi:hypothetical protein